MSTVILSILAGLGGMFGWGTSDFFAGLFSKKIGYFKTFFWSQLAGLVLAILLISVYAVNLKIPALVVILLPLAAIFYACVFCLIDRHDNHGNNIFERKNYESAIPRNYDHY